MRFLFFLLLILVVMYWAFLFTTYALTCKSYEVFDNAQTKMSFPWHCNASFGGGEYKVMDW